MTDQLHVARNISAEIEDAELKYAKRLFYDRAGGKPVAQISEYSACSWPAHQLLSVLFYWHEHTTTRKARYSAEFERETEDKQWQLSQIGFTGEQVRAGQPIHFKCTGLPQVIIAASWLAAQQKSSTDLNRPRYPENCFL